MCWFTNNKLLPFILFIPQHFTISCIWSYYKSYQDLYNLTFITSENWFVSSFFIIYSAPTTWISFCKPAFSALSSGLLFDYSLCLVHLMLSLHLYLVVSFSIRPNLDTVLKFISFSPPLFLSPLTHLFTIFYSAKQISK